MLYNLTADASELDNLLEASQRLLANRSIGLNLNPESDTVQSIEATLDANLRGVINYPAVALDVARYGQESFVNWRKNTQHWKEKMTDKRLRWHHAWESASIDPFESIEEWLAAPPKVMACRSSLSWPPEQ